MTLAAADHTATAAGMALGSALDQLLGDPRRGHPVAGFGLLASRLEQLVEGGAQSHPDGGRGVVGSG
jgi:cobalamin biosynthesis protein CobD/CbiB